MILPSPCLKSQIFIILRIIYVVLLRTKSYVQMTHSNNNDYATTETYIERKKKKSQNEDLGFANNYQKTVQGMVT